MILCLLRHGESIANKKNILSGGVIDVELSEKGVKQSENAGKILRDIKFDIVYTSKMKRAISTAYLVENNIGYNFPSWIKDHKLNERSYGIIEGYNYDYLNNIFGKEKMYMYLFSLNSSPPKGESNFHVYSRVKEFYDENIKNNIKKDINILIVSHFTVTISLMAIIENIDLNKAYKSLYIENAKPIIYEIKNN